jgi:ribosomal protein L13
MWRGASRPSGGRGRLCAKRKVIHTANRTMVGDQRKRRAQMYRLFVYQIIKPNTESEADRPRHNYDMLAIIL